MVLTKLQRNLLPLDEATICVWTNPPPNAAKRMMKSISMGLVATVCGVVNDFICRSRVRWSHTSYAEPDKAYISEGGLCSVFRLLFFFAEACLWSAEY